MDPIDRRDQESALGRRLDTLPGFEAAGSVLLYVSAFPEEIDTGPWLRHALASGKRLILPSVDRRSRSLRLAAVSDLDLDLRPGHRGIPEPSPNCPPIDPGSVDWALVPGLAFDAKGQRLGRGAGHYDRLLPGLRPDAARWALILDVQWVESLPIEPHDQPLDGVADSRRIVHGSRRTSVIP